ncbi:MAG: GspH/FimT family pseudopilin [Burkholderiales bacterium]|jgi:type IV fimbrial biogenesis protein FimT|nr:GspH/FimT family pseudopilin [Burkholderiales bacterium]
MKTYNNIRGFTLVELMITVALMAFLLMAAMPSVRVYLENTKVRNVAESIAAGMQTAKFYAVKNNAPTEIVLGGSGWAIWRLDNATSPATQINPAVEAFAWDDWAGVTVTVAPKTATTATFNGGNGWLSRSNLTATTPPPDSITVTSTLVGTRRLQVDVLMTGSVRVCDLDLPTSDPKSCSFTSLQSG